MGSIQTIGRKGIIGSRPKKANGLYKLVMDFKSIPLSGDSFDVLSYGDSGRTIVKFDNFTYNLKAKLSITGFQQRESSTQSTINSLIFRTGFGSNYVNDPSFEIISEDDTLITSCSADPPPDLMVLAGVSPIMSGTSGDALRCYFDQNSGFGNTICERKSGTIEVIFTAPEGTFSLRPNPNIAYRTNSIELITL